MKRIETILFDFDGVILESVDVKGWAFGKLFEEYPQHTDEIVLYHHANGGISRFVKFRYIYDQILKLPLPEGEFHRLCENYSNLVFNRVVKSPFVPGAFEFVKKFYKQYPFFIISGTPQEEMLRVVEARGLNSYFKGIYGSPDTKDRITKNILSKHSYDANRVVFVGDAVSDLEASRSNGAKFIARIPEGRQDIFQKKEVDYKIKDLCALENVIKKFENVL